MNRDRFKEVYNKLDSGYGVREDMLSKHLKNALECLLEETKFLYHNKPIKFKERCYAILYDVYENHKCLYCGKHSPIAPRREYMEIGRIHNQYCSPKCRSNGSGSYKKAGLKTKELFKDKEFRNKRNNKTKQTYNSKGVSSHWHEEHKIEELKNRLIDKHGDKYNFETFHYDVSRGTITIDCNEHGTFTNSRTNFIRSNNVCPSCNKGSGCNLTNKTFIKKSRLKHGDLYDYGLVNVKTAHDRVDVVCKIHGIFSQLAYAHISGKGCKQCAIESMLGSTRNYERDIELYKDLFQSKMNELHLDIKVKDISEYGGYNKPITFICNNNHEFISRPINATTKEYFVCPVCNSGRSKEENIVKEWLGGLDHETNLRGKIISLPNHELDFIIGDIAIEVNGIYWHSTQFKSFDYHIKKRMATNESGYELLQFYDVHINDFPDVVKSKIYRKLGMNRCCNIDTIKELTAIDAIDFIMINSYDNNTKGKLYGLYSNGELVAVLVLDGNTITNIVIKNYTTVSNLSDAIKSIEDCHYYHHRNDDGLMDLDFKYICETRPNYVYTNGNNIITRDQIMATNLKKYDPKLTLNENMNNNSYYKLVDSGGSLYRIR